MSDIGPEHTQNPITIDYELDESLRIDTPARLKALGDPLRLTIVDLVLERAMTVTEIAARVDRPRGSVAHHVGVLQNAGLLRVVATRKVRAIDERFYGRAARTYVVEHDDGTMPFLAEALDQVDHDTTLPAGSTFRHARVDPARVEEYLSRLQALALEFSAEPRSGDTEFGLLFYVFPTNRKLTS